MVKSNDLFKKASLFEKLATSIEDQVKNLATAIVSEINGGERAVRSLMAKGPKYASSKTLQTLAQQFPALETVVNAVDVENSEASFEKLKEALGGLTFFTSVANSGMGYDPITHEGGAWSPASYLDRIKVHVDNMGKALKIGVPAAPQNQSNPMAEANNAPAPGGNQPKRQV